MWQLYPVSRSARSRRKVRLLLGEKGAGYELVRESPWEQRDEFVDLNPAGQTPVLVEKSNSGLVLIDSAAICEYLEETIERASALPGTAANRAEIRRLAHLVRHEVSRRGGSPAHVRADGEAPRPPRARQTPRRYARRCGSPTCSSIMSIGCSTIAAGSRGPLFSLADLAAAAHISVADYLGGIDWRGHERTRHWYSGMKSRPSFRPLLSERMEVIAPPDHYDKVDF